MKVQTKNLSNAALDWAAGVADEIANPMGWTYKIITFPNGGHAIVRTAPNPLKGKELFETWLPSADYAPELMNIALREKIGFDFWQTLPAASFSLPVKHPNPKYDPSYHRHNGKTVGEAVMRTFVSRYLGDEVEIPDELC